MLFNSKLGAVNWYPFAKSVRALWYSLPIVITRKTYELIRKTAENLNNCVLRSYGERLALEKCTICQNKLQSLIKKGNKKTVQTKQQSITMVFHLTVFVLKMEKIKENLRTQNEKFYVSIFTTQ